MKEKYFSMYASCEDSKGEKHIVTVVGKFEQTRKEEIVQEFTKVETKPSTFVDGVLTFGVKRLNRKLTLGMSICHPTDKFDEEIGISVAKNRIKRGEDLGQIETSDVTMLTKDAIMAEIITKLNHICQNIDKYLP